MVPPSPRTPAWPPRSAPRLFVAEPLAQGAAVVLEGAQAHYLARVMRAGPGDAVVLCDDATGEWLARVTAADRRDVALMVEERLRPREAVPDLVLCAGLLKKDRFDLVLEKATELGVAAIQPVIARRCVADSLNLERARAVVTEAAEQCARTAARPIASGRVSRRAALAWLAALCLVGLIVLLQLHRPAQLVALASLLLVAAYPYMKRLTGWPQAWLGLVFTWAAPVGWVEAHGWRDLATLAALYAGCWAWVMGYDTIYACQDREDDAVVGIGSSARSLGRHIRPGVALLYTLALAGWATAIWQVRPDPLALLALAPVAAHLGWQTLTLHPDDASNVLTRFRSNRFAGLLMALGCGVVGTAG